MIGGPQSTNSENQRGGVVIWVTPVLLAGIAASSVGGYGQLAALNDGVAETNRLAELRGSTAAELNTLKAEVERLRIQQAKTATHDQVEQSAARMRESLAKLVNELLKKVDQDVFLQHTQETMALIRTMATFQERLVTQDQLTVLVGRVEAISRRLGEIQGGQTK